MKTPKKPTLFGAAIDPTKTPMEAAFAALPTPAKAKAPKVAKLPKAPKAPPLKKTPAKPANGTRTASLMPKLPKKGKK